MLKNRLALALGLSLVAMTASGCPLLFIPIGPEVPPTPTPIDPATLGGNRAPIIQAFDYSPKTGVTKNDAISFTVDPTVFNNLGHRSDGNTIPGGVIQ